MTSGARRRGNARQAGRALGNGANDGGLPLFATGAIISHAGAFVKIGGQAVRHG